MLSWVAVTVAGSWLFNRAWQPGWMVLCAFAFMTLYAPYSMLVLIVVTMLTGLAVITCKNRQGVVLAVLFFNILFFLLYRFFDQQYRLENDLVFLGLAFYLLRVIHLLLESIKGNTRTVRWHELITWLWFLPTLQVGPIHRFAPFQRDLIRRRWDSEVFFSGLQRMLLGYAKLVILGTYLVDRKWMNWVDSLNPESWIYHYCSLLGYGASLYVKFAGYSDIAIGFALLLGFRVMENFNAPFVARDIMDFWRRWHISLSSWCREYVYMPVISMTRSPFFAALGSMLVLGIWHELSWRYLFWGAWHGIGIACCHAWKKTRLRGAILASPVAGCWALLCWLFTLHFVLASFALTSVDTLAESLHYWRVLLGIK
jgi:alginate O-acetyltransferase complex protein AlgI